MPDPVMSIAARIEAPPPAADDAPEDGPLGRLAVAAAWLDRVCAGRAPARPELLVLGSVGPTTDGLLADVGLPAAPLHVTEAADQVAAGAALAEARADAGTDLLVLAAPELSGPHWLPATLAAICLLTDAEPVRVVPSAAATGPAPWSELVAAVRDRRRTIAGARDTPARMLDELAAPGLALATGLLLGAAARRVPVVLDGLGALAAGLGACSSAWSMKGWLAAADDSARPAARAALDYLRIEPLLRQGVSTDDGAAGALAVQALRQAAILRG